MQVPRTMRAVSRGPRHARSVYTRSIRPRLIASATLMLAAQFAGLAFTSDAFAASALTVSNAPGTLISDDAGSKRITFKLAPGSASEGAQVVATLYRYDDNAELSQTPVDTYRASASNSKGGAQVAVNVSLPGPGLYVLDAKLVSASGGEGESVKVSLAALASGNGTFKDAGVATHFGQRKGNPATVLSLIKRAGFTWIRDELYWSEVEKTPGKFQFGRNENDYGGYVRQAAKMNIKPLIVLDYGNARAYPALFRGPQGFPRTDQERDLFVRYAQKVVGFYGDDVKTWEIWNEPAFSRIGYDNYVALLKPVYTAIKKVSPDANVVSCGGGGAGGGPGGDCIAQIVKAGALEYQDGFSIHPYMSPYDPDHGYSAQGSPLPRVNVPTVWPHLRDMTKSHPRPDIGRLKVYITEIGWPSSPAAAGLSEQKQAAYAARTFLLSRRFNAVETVMWYDFVDDGVKPADKEANFGLVRLDLTPKPAYVAVTTLMRNIGSRAWDRALVDNGDTKVFQYGGDDRVIVGWRSDVDADPVPTSVPVPPGTYKQIDWQGATSTLTVKEGFQWKLGALPKYLIPAK
ncbi:cellulase family glycosylhydrolase [Caballeronia sp. LZ025]|uniref:cellulase family glycosylhydrolase n=1 Tax=Caballeronia TaxID=1827195 RepID=UPI001FD56EE9|nr:MULTISPECIES: cellulase family glycosylhydrolase [Caballeronia]MDR5733738.1 cellulase family glycosylhydrolase [Caballeronia sp. LZ025]